MLKDDINRYMDITGVTNFKFCVNSGISLSTLRNILTDVQVKPTIEERVYKYMLSTSKELNQLISGMSKEDIQNVNVD